jgi:hypothetical protein
LTSLMATNHSPVQPALFIGTVNSARLEAAW